MLFCFCSGTEEADDMVVADQDTTLLFDGLKFFLAREALSPSSHIQYHYS